MCKLINRAFLRYFYWKGMVFAGHVYLNKVERKNSKISYKKIFISTKYVYLQEWNKLMIFLKIKIFSRPYLCRSMMWILLCLSILRIVSNHNSPSLLQLKHQKLYLARPIVHSFESSVLPQNHQYKDLHHFGFQRKMFGRMWFERICH